MSIKLKNQADRFPKMFSDMQTGTHTYQWYS